MRSFILIILWIVSCQLTVEAQDEHQVDSNSVETNTFWDNWYGQVGMDMNLIFPEGHNLKHVFPNGKSFGINASVGKWFSPDFGGRFKLTWNNGIFANDHNTWLAPYGEPGQNHRDGGFITFIGDIQLNLHNLFDVYRPGRKWNLIVAPRAGGYLNIDNGYISGAHVLGVGVINTYRLSEKWQMFADLGYHFVSSINGISSGKGHGSNGFVELGVGVEYALSKHQGFKNTEDYGKKAFWKHWFVQAGVGMSLVNPYGTNIKNVFPNGNTLGVNVGVGKWFSPEAGVRGGVNWQNGIIVNHHASYLDPEKGSGGDPDKNNYVALYADMFFNLHNMIGGHDESRKWNAIIYPRMGLAKNFASSYEECPLVGFGTEQTYKINDKLKLYADVSYQVTTGGFLDAKFDTGRTGSNGWFDINVGVQYELGKKYNNEI